MENIGKSASMRGIYVVFFISMLVAFSIGVSAQSNLLMPTEQIVSYPVNFKAEDNKIPGSEINNYFQTNSTSLFHNTLLNGMLDGSIDCGYLQKGFDNPILYLTAENYYEKDLQYRDLGLNDLLKIGSSKETITIEKSPGILMDTTVVFEGEWKEGIMGVRFFESWHIDTETDKFEKSIKCISPYWRYVKNGNVRKQIICEIIPTDYSKEELREIRENAQLSNRIAYAYHFFEEGSENYNGIRANAPFLNNVVQNRLIDYVFDLAKTRKKMPRDFYSQEPLTANELKGRLQKDEVFQMEIRQGIFVDTTIHVSYKNEEIKSLVFIEDWYVSKDPFMVFKDVVGIAPVRYEIGYDNEIKKVTIPFVIYFDENKIEE